jgi:cyclophilin family peptidyl-prolyl cis-trans isomerase
VRNRVIRAYAVVVVVAACAVTARAQSAGQRSGGAAPAPAAAATPARSPGAGPVLVFETNKGTFEIETYPNEAPKSVEHILALVKRNFYNGLRFHRVEPDFVAQFGDPQTRDMSKRDYWGSIGSGNSIGVAEISPKRPHKLGAVALAHRGDPRGADSQMYIALNGPERYAGLVQGRYAVIGQVISGMEVVMKLSDGDKQDGGNGMPDVIRRVTVKAP